MWAEGLDSDVRAYKSTLFRIANPRSPEEKEAMILKANAMAKEMIKSNPIIAGQEVNKRPTDEEIAEKVIRDASVNIYGVIDRLPANLAIQASRNLLAGIAKPNDREMQYLFMSLSNPEYLANKDDVGDLVEAAKLARDYSQEALDPEATKRYTEIYEAVTDRIVKLLENSQTDGTEAVLKARMSAWPRFVNEAISRKLGLIR
jgi:hypothetical protein